MSAKRRLERASDDRRPVVTDDFIYDDPAQSQSGSEAESPYSDTPEEAIRKLTVKDFPVTVLIDCAGNDLYRLGRENYLAMRKQE